MVPLLGLLLEHLPLLELVLGGEGDAVHALQRVVVGAAQPVRAAVARAGKPLDLAGVWDMWPAAEVDQVPVAVHGGEAVVRDLVGDQAHFERVELEHLQGVLFAQHQALELVLLLDLLLHHLLNVGELLVRDDMLPHVAVVVEPVLQGRADGQVAPILLLQSTAQHVAGGVPEHRLGVGVVELEQPEPAVPHQRAVQVPELPLGPPGAGTVGRGACLSCLLHAIVLAHLHLHIVLLASVFHLGDDHALGQPVRYGGGDVQGGGLPAGPLLLAPVGQHHLDRHPGHLLYHGLLLLPGVLEHLHPVRQEGGVPGGREGSAQADAPAVLDAGAPALDRPLLRAAAATFLRRAVTGSICINCVLHFDPFYIKDRKL
mmetsp:Transcript_14672/g.21589  ORF Transcript_14672/g.21589 Transcript_14672/m.21589 type:complete len:372 (-) Transcript_14672:176-1291(-)